MLLNQVQAGMSAVGRRIARCLQLSGITVTDYIYAENWRRPPKCKCSGCEYWRKALSGKAPHNQKKAFCDNRYLAWKDKVPSGTRWNPVIACFWIVILSLCFVDMYMSIGVVAIVTTAGKNDLLTQYFKASAYTAAWYIGLVDGTSSPTYAASDTMASHSGWTENTTAYSSQRLVWTGGTASAGSIDNSASPATFAITSSATIAGLFMCNNNLRGGSTGMLYSEGSFTQGNRSVLAGDNLSCTATETVS